MAALSVSLLKLVQQVGASSSEAKQKNSDGFSALLDMSQRSPDAIKEKQQDPVAGLAIQPVFFSPDTNAPLAEATLQSDDVLVDAPAKKDEPAISLPRDDRSSTSQSPRERDAAQDRSRTDAVSASDKPADSANQPEPAQASNDPDDGKVLQADADSDSVATSSGPVAAANDDEPATQPATFTRIVQLIRDFQQQLAELLGQGNPSAVFELVRNFHAQLQAILQGNNNPVIAPAATQSNVAALIPSATSGETVMPASQVAQETLAPMQAAVSAAPASVTSDPLASTVATPSQILPLATQSPELALNSTSADALVSKTMDDIRQLPSLSSETDQAITDDLLQRLETVKSLMQVAQTNNDSIVLRSLMPNAYVAPALSGNETQTPLSLTSAINVQTTAAAVVAAAASNTSFADQGENQGDSRQQSPLPLPVSSTGATSSEASAKIHGASFSRLLNQEPTRPVLDQVAFQIKTALKDGSSQITIQLDPVELGKLDIKLQVASDGRTQVVVTADNKDTLALLQKDSAGLERALSDAGLKADSGSLSFNLRQGQQERDPEYAQASGSYNKTIPEEEIPPASVIARSYIVNLAEGLDIKI